MNRKWGKKRLLRSLINRLIAEPPEEPMSLRQIFYQFLPEIEARTPDWWREQYPHWGQLIYDGLIGEMSDMFLDGELSYRDMGIIDNSGASEYIYQNFRDYDIPPPEECTPWEPVEVWVENNATFNSLIPLFSWRNRENHVYFKLNLVSGKGYAKSQQIEALELDRPEVKHILVLNDFDPAGWTMATLDLPKRLGQKGLDIEVHWVGVRPDQIPDDRKATSLVRYKGKRAKAFREAYPDDPLVQRGFGYEVQVLTPSEIRKLVILELLRVVVPDPHDVR